MEEDGADPNFTTLQTLTLALSANPEYMAGVWSAWCTEMEADGWTEKQVSEAQY